MSIECKICGLVIAKDGGIKNCQNEPNCPNSVFVKSFRRITINNELILLKVPLDSYKFYLVGYNTIKIGYETTHTSENYLDTLFMPFHWSLSIIGTLKIIDHRQIEIEESVASNIPNSIYGNLFLQSFLGGFLTNPFAKAKVLSSEIFTQIGEENTSKIIGNRYILIKILNNI